MGRFKEYLNEGTIFEKRINLENWYRSEKEKISSIKDLKKWNLKNTLLFKKYSKIEDKLSKEKNPYAWKGDANAKYLYHYTNGDSLIQIINDNTMLEGGGEFGGISFTTNANLWKRKFIFWYSNEYSEGKDYRNIGVKIKFDYNLMKKDKLKFKYGHENIGTHAGEEEIRLMQSELINPMKYIKEIIVFKNKEKNYAKLIDFLNSKHVLHKSI